MKVKSECEVAQSFPTLSDPMDCSLPGFSIHGIFQARGLEWGAIAFSDDSSRSYQILVNSSNTLETSERCAMWILIRYHQCTFTCHCRRALVLKHCYKKKTKMLKSLNTCLEKTCLEIQLIYNAFFLISCFA